LVDPYTDAYTDCRATLSVTNVVQSEQKNKEIKGRRVNMTNENCQKEIMK
jgi:hypothetical protein